MTEPNVTVADAGPLIRAEVTIPGSEPDRVLAAFTDPAMLVEWWGGELGSTLEPGTPYTVTFTKIGHALTGEVVGYSPDKSLEFTWAWDGEASPVRRTVLVTVAPDAGSGGTALTIVHGPHADDAPDASESESVARTEHREGWEFFLPRLVAYLSAA